MLRYSICTKFQFKTAYHSRDESNSCGACVDSVASSKYLWAVVRLQEYPLPQT
jgi:hypothetical protein